jgi:hypothetical protein
LVQQGAGHRHTGVVEHHIPPAFLASNQCPLVYRRLL